MTRSLFAIVLTTLCLACGPSGNANNNSGNHSGSDAGSGSGGQVGNGNPKAMTCLPSTVNGIYGMCDWRSQGLQKCVTYYLDKGYPPGSITCTVGSTNLFVQGKECPPAGAVASCCDPGFKSVSYYYSASDASDGQSACTAPKVYTSL